VLVLVDSISWLRRAVLAVVAALALLATLTVVQQATKSYGSTYAGLATVTPDLGTQRSNGPLSANFFAEVLAAGVPLAGYLAWTARRTRRRALLLGCAGVMVAALVFTWSRAALVALLAAAVVVAVLRRMPVRRVLGGAAVLAVLTMIVLPVSLRDRVGALGGLAEGTQATDSSLRGRLGENLAAVSMFADHPILGVGPGNFEAMYPAYAQRIGLDPRPEVRGAHSLYLEALAQTGLVGAVVFFGLLAAAVRGPVRNRRRQRSPDDTLLVEACAVALVAFLVCAVTLHLAYPRYLWVFVALGFAAGRVRPGEAAP